jgi:L-lysine 6-transaminase
VENCLKAAFDWKVRKNLAKGVRGEFGSKVIHFREAFHGRTGYTMSLTNTDPAKVLFFPKFDWPRVDNPKITFPLEQNLAEVEAAEQRAILQIQEACCKHGDDVAALIIEPIQGEGGDNHFRVEFLRELRRLADQYEFMLIYDEVQTGVGLTGKFWCFEHFEGAEPDLLAFGKKMQVCGMLAGKRINEVEDNVFHLSSRINSTWGGNLVDMVRAQRYLEIIEEDGLVENARQRGETLVNGLRELESRHGVVSNARGLGLFAAFDLPSGELRDKAWTKGIEKGVMSLKCGPRSIRFRPALAVTDAEITQGLDMLEAAIKEVG